MYAKNVGAYKQVEIMTADPARLVVLCYGGAIENLKTAISCYETGTLEKKAEALAKALDFIGELNRGLDFEKGGQIAAGLNALYNYSSRRIMEGDLKRDTKAFEEVIRLLTELRLAWEEIIAHKGAISTAPTEHKRTVSGLPHRIEV